MTGTTGVGASLDGFVWRKASYSANGGMECVEVGWQTSSYSVNRGGECVEAGPHLDGSPVHALRDSKHPDHTHLTLSRPEWLAFLHEVKREKA